MSAKNKKNKISRRKFLASAAASAVFLAVPRHILGGSGNTPPSEKLNIAGIGVGGMGLVNLQNMQSENIVALCDVDEEYSLKTAQQFPNAKRYKDFRQMLEREKDIDAVLIATPDHTHAVIAMAAINAGKHVYCQKPLTHNIFEARKLAEAAKKAGVVTQMGIQGHSGEGIRLICEWIWDGAIGKVSEVQAWSSLTYYPWGHAYWSTTHSSKPSEKLPVPKTLDWDLWLGPAPYRDYHPCYHPGKWRAWWDFGCGMLGDRGCHTLDAVFWTLKLGRPDSVEATTTGFNEDTHPIASIVKYHFPARGQFPPLNLTWYDGLAPLRPDALESGRRMADTEGGVLFFGDKGTLMCGVYADSPQLIPYSKMQDYKKPQKTIPRIQGGHEQDWLKAIKNGTKAGADFDYSGPLTEMVLLGNIAKRFSTKLAWDGDNIKFTNNSDANKYISREYRKDWSL